MNIYDKKHKSNMRKYVAKTEAAYIEFAKKVIAIANDPLAKNQKSFKYSNRLKIQKKVDKLTGEFNAELLELMSKSIAAEWALSNTKNDALISATIKAGKKVGIDRGLNDRNIKALQSFISRKVNGMNLSDRVWNLTQAYKDELEMHLQLGIMNGDSAAIIARRTKQYLNEPDKLFRRVRDASGKLVLSKPAKAYNPGRGVCRSSFKNARRLAATETNMAYRRADYERWNGDPAVVGFEVMLSVSHPVRDICDELKGKYPKNFIFTGWHPNCFCYAVPVLLNDKEFDKYTDSILEGKDFDSTQSKNYVDNVPKGFDDWVKTNQERIEKMKGKGTLPYFITDNFKGGNIPSK